MLIFLNSWRSITHNWTAVSVDEKPSIQALERATG